MWQSEAHTKLAQACYVADLWSVVYPSETELYHQLENVEQLDVGCIVPCTWLVFAEGYHVLYIVNIG